MKLERHVIDVTVVDRMTIAELKRAHELALLDQRFDDAVRVDRLLAEDRLAARAAARRWRMDDDQFDVEIEAANQRVNVRELMKENV